MKECNQCGKCCTKYSNGGLSATAREITRWERHRPDIHRYVADGNIWMDPDTGEQIELCPWLRKAPGKNIYTCDIYHDRPEDCRHYPVTIEQMINDDCEMLDKSDLLDTSKAQRALNLIMIDSRPAYD
jgi:Fe-S-cluster containining protein